MVKGRERLSLFTGKERERLSFTGFERERLPFTGKERERLPLREHMNTSL